MNLVPLVLIPLASSAPMIAVLVVGLVLALLRTRTDTRFRWAVAGLLLLLVGSVSGVFTTLLVTRLQEQGDDARQIGLILGAVNLGQTVLATVGWVLLLVALFRGRANPDRPSV